MSKHVAYWQEKKIFFFSSKWCVSINIRHITEQRDVTHQIYYVNNLKYEVATSAAQKTRWNLITKTILLMLIAKIIIHSDIHTLFFFLARQPPSGPWPPPHSRGFLWFLDHTQRHTTVGRTPLDEWSVLAEISTWQHTTLTTDKHLCPWWDSNPRSQQASGRRPTP